MAMQNSGAEKILIIVESPTKARTIKKFLPAHCVVLASNGHVRDLPTKNLGIEVENDFTPHYELSKGKEAVIRELKKELKNSAKLMLATDEDREGESISWHLVELLKPKIPFQRMVFHEITKKAVLRALESGRDLDMNLINAQEARRILDRLYGYTISPLLWRKLSQPSLSAGRVQSPGLRLVVDRERERLAFVTGEYWDLLSHLSPQNSTVEFTARLERVGEKRIPTGKDFDPATGKLKSPAKFALLSEEEAQALLVRLEKATWQVEDVKERERKQRPAPPFITSTLQQEANRKLRLGSRETMSIAQRLYENGFITYMRTDSPALSQEGINAAREAVQELFGAQYLSKSPRQYSARSSSAQEAHEAIRPTGDTFVHPTKSGLKGKERSLYEMIWKRTLASQMAEALKATTTVHVIADDAQFNVSGTRILFDGFIKVYVESVEEGEEEQELSLPALQVGEVLTLQQLVSERHETKPPQRFNEASLVQELEKLGIGRPSTYASIIEKLFEKDYVIREGNALVPTFVAFAIVQLLEKNFANLVDYGFTSTMEDSLDEIAHGKLNSTQFLTHFYLGKEGLKADADEKMSSIVGAEAKHIELPHISEGKILIGRYGPYVEVANQAGEVNRAAIPAEILPATITNDALHQLIKEKNQAKQAVELGIDEQTKLPILLFEGRYGPYYQLGEKSSENPMPKRANVPSGVNGEELPLEQIQRLLTLPLTLGLNPENEKEVFVGIGPYGPYVGCEKEFRSLDSIDQIFSLTLEEALKLLAQPKTSARGRGGAKSGPVTDFGEQEGKTLALHHGRYGFYGKWGEENFTLPYKMRRDAEAVAALTLEEVLAYAKEPKKAPPARKGRAKRSSTKKS